MAIMRRRLGCEYKPLAPTVLLANGLIRYSTTPFTACLTDVRRLSLSIAHDITLFVSLNRDRQVPLVPRFLAVVGAAERRPWRLT